MRDTHFQKLMTIRQCMSALHAAHPDSPAVDAMHAALFEAARRYSHMFTAEQYENIVRPLSGGTKPPVPPEPVE